MTDNVFLFSTLGIFLSLTLASGIFFISRKIKIPFAVGLLLSGLGIGIAGQNFEIFNKFFQNFHFSHDVVFYIFLPTLIFESAYHLNFRHFQNSIKEISILATIGFFISVLIIAGIMGLFLSWPLKVLLLFGVIISATDPVAILAIFKDMRVPGRLKTLVDGESLLNDASAVISFQFLQKVAIGTAVISFAPGSLLWGSEKFLIIFFGSIMLGFIFGWVFAQFIANSCERGIQLALSLVLAHITFIVVEGLLEMSGILAVMTAGIVMGNIGRIKFNKKTSQLFSHVWEFMTFLSNSLIFILLGVKISNLNFLEHWQLILLASLVVIFLARPLSVLITFFFTNFFQKKEQKIPLSYQFVSMWGGIRGALSAAVVMLIPADFLYAEQLQIATAGVIITTFVLNATTMPFLLKKLQITNFSLQEKIQKFEAQVLIDEVIKSHLNKMLLKKYISKEVFNILEKKYSQQEKKAIIKLHNLRKKFAKKSQREIEKALNYYALGIEKKIYRDLFENHEICEKKYLDLIASINRQNHRLYQGELPNERNCSENLRNSISTKICGNRILNFISPKLCKNLLQKIQNQQISERIQHFRARRIASWEVVLSFKKLAKYLDFIKNSEAFGNIIKQYEKWNINAEKKLEKLRKDFPMIINHETTRFAENSCLNQAMKLKKELLAEEFISKKVSAEIDKEIQKQKQ